MAEIRITIKGFEDYKGRKDVTHNSWFRCSNRLLEDPDFYDFEPEEMLVWIYLLSIASQKNSECVTISYPHAQSVARLSEKAVNSAIKKLKKINVISASTLRQRNVRGTFTCATNKQDKQGQDKLADRDQVSSVLKQEISLRFAKEIQNISALLATMYDGAIPKTIRNEIPTMIARCEGDPKAVESVLTDLYQSPKIRTGEGLTGSRSSYLTAALRERFEIARSCA